jgi:glycosyltransferase involved in cell wall biosynthesis
MRVLVVTNFTPDAGAPQRGRWVLDQVEETRRLGIEVELFGFPRGSRHYLPAAVRLRRLLRRERFDLVHVHYGLTAWSAVLAGARPLVVTFHGTDVRHPLVGPLSRRLAWRVDLVAAASRALFSPEGDRPGLPPVPGSALTCGAELLTGGSIEPELMPLWLNSANAVLVTSDYEGFGMVCVEALACNVPVLSTPVGIAPFALAGIAGTLCAPFEPDRWAGAVAPHLATGEPRIGGAARAASLSATRMAERVVVAYRELLDRDPAAR